jgi:hypothetical protein
MAKRVGVTLLIALILVPGVLRAEFWTCSEWNEMPESGKVGYAMGWMEGSGLAATVLSGDVKARNRFWPQGHRVGSVKLELDIACKKTPTSAIWKAIGDIVDEKRKN